MPRPGDALGELSLEVPLGAGVTTEAWLARNADGAPVFVKCVHGHLTASDEVRALLRHEIALLGRLESPGLPRLVRDGGDDRVPWLGATWLPGETLADRVAAAGPVPPAAALALAVGGAAALADLHGLVDEGGRALEAVHRDVSPANLLVDREGTARLVDLGVASSRLLPAAHRGGVRGTFRTMAPEQARGEPPDPRGDLFSLSASVWEALTGRPFRAGPPARALVAAAEAPPPRFAQLPGVSPALAAVLDRAAAFPAAARFESAQALRDALLAAGGGLDRSRAALGTWAGGGAQGVPLDGM